MSIPILIKYFTVNISLTHNNPSLILHTAVTNTIDIKKIAFFGSGAMSHGITRVCIQAGVAVVMRGIRQEGIDNGDAKIRKGFDFLMSEPEKIIGSFKMIGRQWITGSHGYPAGRNQPILHKEDYHG